MGSCIFCDIINGEEKGSFVYRDDRISAFLDIQPINPGHTLIVPNDHAPHLADLPVETGAHMFRVAQRIGAAIRDSEIRCEGINFFLADGKAAMQDVFHVHLHVFPRFERDGFGLKFGSNYFNPPPRSDLNEWAIAIRKVLK